MKNISLKLTKYIAISACMICLSFILNRFLSFSTNWFRIGLSSVPIVFTGLILGPIWGGIVGACSDLVSAFLVPQGAYFPGYTLDSALLGILPFLTMKLFKGRNKLQTLIYFLLTCVILVFVSLFCTYYSTFKKQELSLAFRISIPFLFLIYFIVIYFIHLFLFNKQDKFKRINREDNLYSLSDLYLCTMVNHIIISLCLLPSWNLIVANVGFLITSFTSNVVYLVSGIVKPLILYFIINPVIKSRVLNFINK